MPLYEYECERGHRFERIVKFSDPPIEICPECGAAVHKLMSSPAIQFKGTGWYITDYARKGGESKDSKDTKSTKSSEAGESKESKDSKDSKESKTEKAPTSESSTETKSKTETSSTPSSKSE